MADARFEPELADLRDWPLPPVRPAESAEYNHGPTAALENALDWIYRGSKPQAGPFVGYGNAGGARAIEQLRQIAVELEMAPIRRAVHLPLDVFRATMALAAPVDPALFAPAEPAAKLMLDDLAWWTAALAAARASS